MVYPNVVVKIPQDYSNIISAILSGVFLLVGAWLAYTGTQKSNQVQKDIAKMQIDERLIAENKLRWSDETRGLVAKFIRICFETSNWIEELKSIELEQAGIGELKRLSEKTTLVQRKLGDMTEIVTEIRLHIFNDKNEFGKSLLSKILKIEKYYGDTKTVPAEELEELTEIARKYFEQQFIELTTQKDD